MEDVYGMGETPCDLAKPRIAPYNNTWKRLQTSVSWCNFKLAQERGLQFHQTRSHAVVLYNTLPAACIEKAVCMKPQDELHQKVRSTLGVPRVVLKSNSQYGLQDPQNQDARSSWEPSSDSKSYREICNNTVDLGISSTSFCSRAPEEIRENKDKKLIKKFENQQHKESFLQDLSQTEKINKFSKESQELIADNNTEIFDLCENYSKQQCSDCNALRAKYEIYAESTGVRPEQPWRHLNPWICHQEKQQSWGQARTFWKTKNVLHSETDAQKGTSEKARKPPNNTFTMVRRRR